jgi:hypothetical protein
MSQTGDLYARLPGAGPTRSRWQRHAPLDGGSRPAYRRLVRMSLNHQIEILQ